MEFLKSDKIIVIEKDTLELILMKDKKWKLEEVLKQLGILWKRVIL